MDEAAPRSTFQQVFNRLLAAAAIPLPKLAARSDVPLETLRNWKKGKIASPQQWQAIMRVGAIIAPRLAAINQLLQAAQYPPLAQLATTASAKDRDLFTPWHTEFSAEIAPIAHDAALIAAQQRMLAMPTQTLPRRRPLPPIARMPIQPNPLFTGRDTELLALAQQFHQAKTTDLLAVVAIAITGLAGLGKTQLASEFVHRYGQYFAGGVLWLRCDTAATMQHEVLACGATMQFEPQYVQYPPERQVQLVREAWNAPLPRLVVFDSVADPQLALDWLPSVGGACVLITSNVAQWSPATAIHTVPLNLLTRVQSVALLHKYRPTLPTHDPHLHQIAQQLGDLPLALHLAGHFLAQYRDTAIGGMAAYAAALEQHGLFFDAAHTAPTTPTDHEPSVVATFELSYQYLQETDTADERATRLLWCAAACAPGEPIPRPVLVTMLVGEPLAAPTIRDEWALSRLVDLGLLTRGANATLLMHRLVATVVRRIPAARAGQTAVEHYLIRYAEQFAADVVAMHVIEPHLRSVVQAAQEREDERSATLAARYGWYLTLAGAYAGAETYQQAALQVRQQLLGRHHADTLESMSLLAQAYQYQVGQRSRLAQPLFEQILQIKEELYGPDSEPVADELYHFGHYLLTLGDYDRAREFLRRSVRSRRANLGLDHADTARSLRSLGLYHYYAGNYRAARRYSVLALVITQKHLPDPSIGIAQTLTNLGQIVHAAGQHAAAERYHTAALAMRMALFGPEHTDPSTIYHNDVAESLAFLGVLAIEHGAFAQARLLLDQARAINTVVLGETSYETGFVDEALGRLALAQNDLDTAFTFSSRARQIYAAMLGEHHPIIARIDTQLGAIWLRRGDDERAFTTTHQALAILQAVFPPDHPETMRIHATLGDIFTHRQQPKIAHDQYVIALRIARAKTPLHPLVALYREMVDARCAASNGGAESRLEYAAVADLASGK